jgi:pimeloyl-ACP methyl ester carboxylesterase
MSELRRPDGVDIHYAVRGEQGPAIVLASYWSWSPEVYAPLLDDLAADHRVVNLHLRGTGGSSRQGPYDMATDEGDLEAVLEDAVEATGSPALLIGVSDSANRSVRLGVRRPDLISAVVAFGTAPFALRQFEGSDAMLASDSVIDAFSEMLQRHYRGGMRVLLEATNPQMDEEELRERIDHQVDFCPQEAAVGRMQAWIDDDPIKDAQRLGDRLWIFAAGGIAGPWLPPREELDRITREVLPDAHVVEAEPGAISRPDLVAQSLRRVSGQSRERAPERK